jgi:large subunit ribosomal protein L32e
MTEQGIADRRKALKLRARMKKRKPAFARPESWRYMRLKENWRRPKGLDHKIRKKLKGWPAAVSTGYRSPRATRELHPSGYREVLVHNVEDLAEIDPTTQAVRIVHTVGKRKRARIIADARKKRVTILNLKETRGKVAEEEKAPEEEEKPTETAKEEEAKTEEPKQSQEKTKRSRGRTKK